MLAKKVTALLVSAALVLALLAGCGGGQQSVARTLLNLLDGKYTNVSVEMDSELEADLRQVLRENEADDLAAIRAALETLLGSTVSFRYLGDGQQGDTTFDLVFYAGADPDKAAQTAYTQWNSTFSTLPDDGQYTARLALVQTENGCFALVKATVDKAGTPDKPDPKPEKPKDPYTQNTDGSYTVNTPDGLQKLFAEKKDDFNEKTVIKLTAGTEYTVDTTSAPLAETFQGELQGNGATITLSGDDGYGLFNQIETGGIVENIRINVKENISEGYTNPSGYIWVGAVAGYNKGAITGCHVTIDNDKSITGALAGGIVGMNENEITDCTVTDGTITGIPYAGGIAGYNRDGNVGSDGSCKVDGTSVTATGSNDNAYAGGLVGQSYGQSKSSTVNGCYTGGGTISATSTSSYANAGGLVGNNISDSGGSAKVTGSYNGSGAITAITESTDSFFAAFAGGLVGYNSEGTVSAIYSDSSQIEAKAKNANGDYNIASVVEADTDTDDNAFAGTGIGYDQTDGRPIAATELPWPKT